MSTKRKLIKYCIRTIIVIVVLLVLVILLPFSLQKKSNRNTNYTLNSELKSEIREETKGLSSNEICLYSIKKTAEKLSFTVHNNLTNGQANCVGYAQMCASIANYSFQMNGYKCKATPVVGYVILCGVNLCKTLKWFMPSKRWENFVKDHDFVEFSTESESFYADASIYDILYKDCKTLIP